MKKRGIKTNKKCEYSGNQDIDYSFECQLLSNKCRKEDVIITGIILNLEVNWKV